MNKIVISQEHDPYFNLALEEELFRNARQGEVTLYLWQNEKTVVIGRNQNPYIECDIEQIKRSGGKIARRISGGGAVYHDLGNLNFTFVCKKSEEDLTKQIAVLQKAVERFGLQVVRSGRNDLTHEGKKFSGHAFYEEDGNAFHHGTMMVDVDLTMLAKVLKPSKLKLESKGITSVKSRVVNLKKLNDEITISSLSEALIDSFREIYGENSFLVKYNRQEKSPDFIKKYMDDRWIYGESPVYNASIEKRTSSGNIQAFFQVEHGLVKELKIFSDSISILDFRAVENRFIGMDFKEVIEKDLLLLAL
ncbi:lipoate-protein ligase [Paenibacillus uliginis N3/975]|uniref:lipoate--protein ligase n=1 Tax=Paenibacillus uliginis N3/975 TaxID=1313296 RepID=A0A1X7HQZ7_9BACL|nr:lipoate--protein ligase [Paenibacillus uliginis]SMF90427.1 lipoate-protein ligase [Paenibacillus uliginis N3/975]